MPECQAYGCTNQVGQCGKKGFYSFPNPGKRPKAQNRDLAVKWLLRIGTGHTVDQFQFGYNKVVCEDHFTPDDFEEDAHIKMCRVLGKEPRYTKLLKRDAVPSVFVHRPMKEPSGRQERAQKRISLQHSVQVCYLVLHYSPYIYKYVNAYKLCIPEKSRI